MTRLADTRLNLHNAQRCVICSQLKYIPVVTSSQRPDLFTVPKTVPFNRTLFGDRLGEQWHMAYGNDKWFKQDQH